MRFKLAALTLALACAAAPAFAQPSASVFMSQAQINALAQQLSRSKETAAPIAIGPIAELAPYRANLEYRTSVGTAAIHEASAELFVILEGAGTAVTGGKLVNERRTNPENRQGDGITGGKEQPIAKGDVLFVPQGEAHWFKDIKAPLIMMSLHVPRK